MAELRLQPEVRQTLELLLSPRLLQSLKILNLPYPDLIERITKEAEENPLLEVERQDEYVELIRYLTSDRKIKKEADFQELPGLENIGKVEKSLEEHLLEQLELEDLEEQPKALARRIIEQVDDFGYVINYPRLREELMKEFAVSRPTVDKALKIVQGFEPEGVGARDLKECLLIQIENHAFDNEALQDILARAVKGHLEALGKQEYAPVAAALGIPENGAVEIADFIKNNLNPNPGSAFGGETRHVIPSFAVEPEGTGFRLVNLETRYGPTINLSPRYLKLLEDPKTDAQTREFLKERLKKARELLEDFQRRSETLEKIARKITETQTAFLKQGAAWLVPLTQQSLAAEFGLHPSTISRTVAEKYLQTQRGLFPLRFLCPRGPKGMTAVRLKALLAEEVGAEDNSRPLTDAQLTERLKARGAKIDRRTVAYYRQQLGLPPASDRQNR